MYQRSFIERGTDEDVGYIFYQKNRGKNEKYFLNLLMNIEVIQSLYRTAKIKWSAHCLERMQERDISIDDVGNCIMSGEIIESYPNDFPHPSCLIFGYTIHHKVLHTVVGYDGKDLHIITAYYPNTIKFMEDLKTRRKK